MLTLVLALSALAGPANDVAEALRQFNAAAVYDLPVLSTEQLQRLENGKIVKIREITSADSPQRAVGMLLTAQPRDAIWVAARTEEGGAASITSLIVPSVSEAERWYQHLDAPFPFADRHWVIDVWDNHAVAEASPCWEHPWRIAPAGYDAARAAVAAGRVGKVSEKQFDSAVKVGVNNGAWVACTVGGRTLLVFHAQSVVGGSIPDRLVTDFTMMTLGKVLRGVETRSTTAATWYDGGLVGGD
ncbi:MAG: hypothetical protein ACI9K2_002076, partial [Myxococcota bacterium]